MNEAIDHDTITVLRAITALALSGAPFGPDDVRTWLTSRGQAVHPQAIGNGFRVARATGLIVEAGWTRSSRPAAHRRRVLLYRGTGASPQ